MNGNAPNETGLRIWYFANFELDELRHELRLKGTRVELESKPLDVLLQLILHSGEIVTKDELLESVWNGATGEGSLPTAISKLRKLVAEGDPPLIVTIPGVGYRLGVPVVCKVSEFPKLPEIEFQPGDSVPGREQWHLSRRLGTSSSSIVWLAEHSKTQELRVFKFALDGVGLKALKREVTLSRYLKECPGPNSVFVRVLEWNFDIAPFFLESEYGGVNLLEWADEHGGLPSVEFQTRLQILIDIAGAVATAHDVGVLHKDLKPANVLVASKGEVGKQILVVDFGIASLLEPSRLGDLNITNLGFTQQEAENGESRSGTLLYLAPEVIRGQSPTASGDVYALGVILYQLAVGDFRRPLSPGWEADIDDPLIREDIAAAACGDPAKRLSSAAELAERLQTVEQRRQRQKEFELVQARAQDAEQKLARARARKPWVFLAIGTLLSGLAISLFLYRSAVRERDRASRETAIANAANHFLVQDLLAEGDPWKTGESKKLFIDAVKDAAPNIDRQFASEPGVAARLHAAVGQALDGRFDFAGARQQYDRARNLFLRSDGSQSQDAILMSLRAAAMEARSNQPGSAARAETLRNDAEASLRNIQHPRDDVLVALSVTRGTIHNAENNPRAAREDFSDALLQAKAMPSFDGRNRLLIERYLAFPEMHLGDSAKAELLFREIIDGFLKIEGQDSAYAVQVRMNLAQALLSEHKYEEAIQQDTLIYPVLVKIIGEDHELTLQVLATRAAAEGSLKRWDDAIRDDLSVYKTSLQKRGPASLLSVSALSDAGLSQCKTGRYADGEANTRKAFQISTNAYGPHAPLTSGCAYALATCLVGKGSLIEASELLRNIDVPGVIQLSSDPMAGADIALQQAEIAVKLHDYSSAARYLKLAAPLLDRPDTDPDDRKLLQNLKADVDAHLQASR